MPLIQVFIATYNRPSLVLNAIHSALIQDFDSFEVIVSDNSTNDKTEVLISKIENKHLSYIRRKPSLPSIDHLNAILQDVTADYFMIFHDDDLMHPSMLTELYNIINKHSEVIAIGSNAFINKRERTTNKLFFTESRSNFTLKSRDEVANQYLKLEGGTVPLPSYLYKKEIALQQRFNPKNGGKYCDVAFIMDITCLGNIIFFANPLMTYYFHKAQDSSTNNFLDRIKLTSYITKTTNYSRKHPQIKRYRILNLYDEMKIEILNKKRSIYSRRHLNCMWLLFQYTSFFNFLKTILKAFSQNLGFIKKAVK